MLDMKSAIRSWTLLCLLVAVSCRTGASQPPGSDARSEASTGTVHAQTSQAGLDVSGSNLPARVKTPYEVNVPVEVCLDAEGKPVRVTKVEEKPRNRFSEMQNCPREDIEQERAEIDTLAVHRAKAAAGYLFRKGSIPAAACTTVAVVFNRGRELVLPELHEMDAPDYPDEARENRESGVVLVHCLVDEMGRVQEPHIDKGVSDLLDAAAIRASMTAQFEPARVSGTPIEIWMVIPIEFSLRR
jgi:protein TonB